jgi:beta-lactamase regulating signal transducer with metallopeptidase domain
MSLGSLVGFAIVFVLVCGVLSALAAAALRVLAWRGLAVERRAAEVAAVVPVAVALGVIVILLLESIVASDHCGTHGHHAHLCLAHGAIWLDRAWAVALVVTSVAVITVRGVLLASAIVRARRVAERLARVAQRAGDLCIVESDRAFSFVAGIRSPTIVVSTAARAVLEADEWEAMLAHERGHVRHRDLRARVALDALLLFAAPLAGIVIRDRWELATERLRDAGAATEIGSSEAVASALVRMARHTTPSAPRVLPAFTPHGARGLASRVEALLEPTGHDEAGARRLVRATWLALVAVLVTSALLAGPLHHALETLLG